MPGRARRTAQVLLRTSTGGSRHIRDWETGTETVEKGICTAGAWEVKVYAREYVTEIFWNDGEVDYILSCRGRELLPVEELLAVIESLTYRDADSLK